MSVILTLITLLAGEPGTADAPPLPAVLCFTDIEGQFTCMDVALGPCETDEECEALDL